MKEIIKKQNRYLHGVTAISFINLGSLEGSFSSVSEEETEFEKKKHTTRLYRGSTDEFVGRGRKTKDGGRTHG